MFNFHGHAGPDQLRRTAQNSALLCFPLPPQFLFFLPSWGHLVELWVRFKAEFRGWFWWVSVVCFCLFVLLCCCVLFCLVAVCCSVLVCVCCCVLLLCCCCCVCVWWVCSGPLRRTPLRWTPKISLFFPSPATVFILFSLSCWSFSLNFGGVFGDRDPQMCTFGVLGLSCASPGGPVWWGRRGFTRQPENSKRAHLRALALQTPPKFHEKTPRERRKNEISGGREQKKREILGPPPSGPPPSVPHPSGLPPLWAPTPSGPHPFRLPPKTKLAKCGLAIFGQQKLAKFGQTRMAKCGQLTLAKCGIGQIRFGQMRPNKVGQMRSRPFHAQGKLLLRQLRKQWKTWLEHVGARPTPLRRPFVKAALSLVVGVVNQNGPWNRFFFHRPRCRSIWFSPPPPSPQHFKEMWVPVFMGFVLVCVRWLFSPRTTQYIERRKLKNVKKTQRSLNET